VELIEKEPEEQGVLPEPEPRYHTASLPVEKSEHGQSIVRILASILVGLILIVLIVLLARWIYHKAHHASENTPPPSTTLKVPSNSSDKNTGVSRPGSGAPQTASPNNSSSPSATSSTTNQQITNTGPGDVAAIFVGATLAAAGLHYILSVRKFNQSQV
jgi:cytoskeletal protein RodZ